MTVVEAIRDLKKRIDGKFNPTCLDTYGDMKLGIEALKRVQEYKRLHIGLHYTPMPGETEE